MAESVLRRRDQTRVGMQTGHMTLWRETQSQRVHRAKNRGDVNSRLPEDCVAK